MGLRVCHRRFRSTAVAVAFHALFFAASSLCAQGAVPPDSSAVEPIAGYMSADIETFARIYIEIAEVRDVLQQDLARFHDEAERRAARERADARIRAFLEEHEVEEDAYEEFVRRAGLEQALREAFEQVVARLREEEG